MVEKPVHYRVEHESRENAEASWEIFLRDDPDDPLRHVGTLTAPCERAAYDRARRLFGWFVHDVWVCPAAAVSRYTADPPAEAAEPVEPPDGEESRTHEI